MEGDTKEMRSLALTPTWSVATVRTIFVVVSLIVERSIHRLSNVSGIVYPLYSNFLIFSSVVPEVVFSHCYDLADSL
jgi:hypothetical protein